MKEFFRVFNKRTLLLLAILCFLNTGILILCADPDKSITLTGEELDFYVQDYPQFLERTISNGKTMSLIGVYQSGFASHRIEKIAEHYRALEGLQISKADNRGLVLFIQYRLTDIFLLTFLFLIVMSFFGERKKGLVYIVRSTENGRGVLFLQRLAILICAAVVSECLLYVTAYAGIHFTLGMNGLDRNLQSLPEFMKCPYSITIREYLLVSCLLKLAGSLLAAVLLYVILGIFSTLGGYILAGLLLLAEIIFALFIEPISTFNHFLYLNLLTIIQADHYFTDCIYLNIFGRAVSALRLCQILLLCLLVILAAIGFIVHGRLYVNTKRGMERFLERIHGFFERHALQRTLTGWEVYKLYIKQGALLLLSALFVLQIHLTFRYQYYYPVNAMERLYYIEYEGEITEELLENVAHKMFMLKENEASLRKTLDKLMNKDSYNDYIYDMTCNYLTDNLAMQKGLQPILDDISNGMEYTRQTGKTIQLIQPYTYDLLINRDYQVKQRASFLELIVILGSLAGIYAYDSQNHMRQIIHTSYRGRKMSHITKPLIGITLCALAAIALHGVQLVHIERSMGFNNLDAPIQSLSFMRTFPLYLSIRGYLLVLFLLRILGATVLGAIVMSLSRLCHHTFTALGLSTFICLLLFSLSGLLPGLDFLNPAFLLSANFFC